MGNCLSCCTNSATQEIQQLKDTICELQDGKLQERFECKICFDGIVSSVFLPCGHCVACARCSRRIKVCPMCGKKVTRCSSIFYG